LEPGGLTRYGPRTGTAKGTV